MIVDCENEGSLLAVVSIRILEAGDWCLVHEMYNVERASLLRRGPGTLALIKTRFSSRTHQYQTSSITCCITSRWLHDISLANVRPPGHQHCEYKPSKGYSQFRGPIMMMCG